MASLVLLTVLLTTTTTPEQAREQRAIPELAPPTTVVMEGSRAGVFALPEGALAIDEEGRAWVSVRTDQGARRVEVHKVPSGMPKLIEVTGAGLHAGDVVELVAADDAEAPPRAGVGPGESVRES